MNNGWIKLHRGLLEWEWFDDDKTFKLFMYLLLSANHKEKNWRGITIPKGHILTGRIKLAKRLGMTQQNIRTSLSKLKSTNEITIKTTNKYSLIKVNNWNEYQQTNQQTTKQSTSNQPATNHNQECKNVKNVKKIDIGDKSPTPSQIMKDFINNQDKQNDTVNALIEKGVSEEVAMSEIKKFINYWCELTKSGKQQRWQTEKTFEIQRRLTTWFNNVNKFKGSNSNKGITII